MPISQENERVKQKIILLYITAEIPSLTQDELLNIALGTVYMDYFGFTQVYDQLLQGGLITQAQHKGELERDMQNQPVWRCDITAEGEAILESLILTLPVPLRHHLYESVTQYKGQQAQDNVAQAVYQADIHGLYAVKLLLKDARNVVCELNLNLPDEEMARRLCRRWETEYQQLYPQLLQFLLSE